MRHVRLGGIVGLMILGAASPGWSTTPGAEGSTVAFASAGGGLGTQGLGAVLSLNFSRGRLVYVVRTSTTTEFNLFGPVPDASDTDYAVLVGKRAGQGRHFASAAAGIGLVRSIRRGAVLEEGGWFVGSVHQKLDRMTVGVALDLKATLNVQGIGVGLNVFGNVNAQGPFVGLAFTVQLGKLR